MRKFWTFFSSKQQKEEERSYLEQIDRTKLPQHVAIIMDGNGRWAQKRGLPRSVGHRYGVEALRRVIEGCVELKINYLTVYAFSTENWKRPQAEVSYLMDLVVEYLRKEIAEMHKQNIHVRPMGDIGQFSPAARDELIKSEQMTTHNTGLELNVALNYGGRKEILDAARAIGEEIEAGKLKSSEITEELFASHLLTAGQPDPDLFIRPSGELRISNFLLWQMAYAEFYYAETYWPDFNQTELYKAILDFQKRSRRYGGI